MNQEKIGKFIAKLRKEKNMTQLDLANKLGITDRAISKWENGRGMPDLSLLKPLCDILDISVNELLSGESLTKKEYQEKLEENILNTIDYSDKEIKSTKKYLKIFLTILIIIIGILLILFGIDIYRMKKGKPVLFSTWGYLYSPIIDIKEDEIKYAIEKYVVEKNNVYHENEKWFASMRVYLLEDKKDHYNVYAWVLEESYYLEDGIIKEGSGASIPHKYVVEKSDNNYIVVKDEIPKDGSYYVSSMKKLFPRSVRKDMENVHRDGTIKRLSLEIDKQVNLYYSK